MELGSRRRRTAVPAAVAGTLLVAGAVAATQFSGDADTPHASRPTAASPAVPPKGSLDFALTLHEGERLISGGAGNRGEQNARIRTPHGPVDLATVGTVANADWRVDPAAARVTVHGAKGYYGNGFEAVYLDFHEDAGTPSPGATSPPPPGDANPRQPGLRTLAWQYAAGHWTTLRTTARHVTEAELRELADGVDFTRRTRMRVAIAMRTTPEHLVFTGWDTRYVRTDGTDSLSAFRFQPIGSTEDVTVELDHGGIPREAQRLPFTVHGHLTYTAAGYGAVLFVDEGNGYHLQVTAIYPSDGSSYRPRTLKPIADLVSVATTPGDSSTWFDAATALP